ncbi:acyltransferase-domain-containing protein [Lophiotrema nucula]|uniref:Acyltransferase-domain-containing protein n=1 Tax=Lophiotrema nucula TaxID=690887 RepID=A0A6A5YTC1_9PLEO|nr:acyltransferase-domain-containing protein [Lophiotrema nucula]
MSPNGLIQRRQADKLGKIDQASVQASLTSEFPNAKETELHPPNTKLEQIIRATVIISCFLVGNCCIHVLQWLGSPLYCINRRWFHEWQVKAKEMCALLLFALNQWASSCTVKVSGDASVRHQIRSAPEGQIILDFPDRLVLIANHQIYTDWIFLWWSAYIAKHHGHFLVVLKDSLRRIPVFGPGMMFFDWIFLSRRWEKDRPRLQEHMESLSRPGSRFPMWLLIFPEGTNLSENTRGISKKWAEKMGIPDLKYILLPRTRGLHLCVERLGDSIEWLYDCTISYDGVPSGEYGQDIYTLKSLYVEGFKAPNVNIHWRRFAVKDIPLIDPAAFDQWLYERWAEKDKLLEYAEHHGHFPAEGGRVEVQVGLQNPLEALRILPSVFLVGAIWYGIRSIFSFARATP